MCGIAGIIGGIDPGLALAARTMSDCISHRGPDAHRAFHSLGIGGTGAGCIFEHRRLAIIDLSADGIQPMTDPATGCVIAFNGEIYNYQVLKAELSGQGHAFRTKSDTEVILRAYAQWGCEAFARLRGMFALALWDPRARAVVLARDHAGIKPLYYTVARAADGAPAIAFASEVRALLKAGLAPARFNPASLRTYLWNGFVIGPETILAGVRELPAGSVAVVPVDSPTVVPERFWQTPAAGGDATDPDPARETLAKSVAQHLIADVPVGVFLSGGVDSSALAALACRAAPGAVRTFNIAFEEAGFDESAFARRVAQSLGTMHVELRLTQQVFQAGLDDALASLDQPTFDAINSFFVSRAVREAGLKVALAGTGGDELFGGYRSFTELPRLRRASHLASHAPRPLVQAAARVAARVKGGRAGVVPLQTRWGKLPATLDARGDLVELYQLAYALYTPEFQVDLIDLPPDPAVRAGLPIDRFAEATGLAARSSELGAISVLEQLFFLRERLLRDTDAASMAVSLEVRVPFLDPVLTDTLAPLDDATRFRTPGTKALLREIALGDLDPSLFDRPKSGFVLPIDVWARQRLKPQIDRLFADADRLRAVGLSPAAVARLWSAYQAGAPGLYWSRIWALFVLLWWSERYGVTL
ncbi:MAG: asparagine synthase (glutamine-hydrolyzing) [Phycisphaerales bacterium]